MHARAKAICGYTKVLSLRLLRPPSDMATSDVALLLCQQSVFRPPLPPSQSNAEGFPCGSSHTSKAHHAAARSVHHGSCVGTKQPTESKRVKQNSIDTCARNTYTLRKHATEYIPFPLAHRAMCVCVCVCITMTASRLPSLQKNNHTYLQPSHSYHLRRRHRLRA